jgi:hypothetical protein
LEIDVNFELEPCLSEQMRCTNTRCLSPRSRAESCGKRGKAEHSDELANRNGSRRNSDGRKTFRGDMKHQGLRLGRVVAHETGLQPFVTFAKPGVDLISTNGVTKVCSKWYLLIVISQHQKTATIKRHGQRIVDVIVIVVIRMRNDRLSSRSQVLLKNRLVVSTRNVGKLTRDGRTKV